MDINHKKPRVNPEDYKDSSRGPFKKGNPGRPKGCLNKETRLKHAVLDTLATREGELAEMAIDKLLTVGASFVPKSKGEESGDKVIVVINHARNDSRVKVSPAPESMPDNRLSGAV